MTDQPTLRDRIRRVLAEADGFSYDCLEPHDYQRHADAILTLPEVLPTPVDRASDGIDWKAKYELEHARHVEVVRSLIADPAALLRGAADEIDRETQRLKDDGVLEPDQFRPCRDATADLRRMADEAQQPACGNCGHPAAWHDPWEGCVGPDGIGSAGSGDCTCTRSPDEAQQPEEAER